MSNYRVGQGFDVHKLVEGRRLVLGGVEIPYEKGALAHSDGDVLIHAIVDAILGVMAMRDIGFHFSDTSEETEGMDSTVILKKVLEWLKEKGFSLENLDATVIIDKPKLSPHIEAIRENLSRIIGIEKENISIKAKTSEGVMFTNEACAAIVNVLVKMNT
jgi:2-C-methyl-D-erythritol 2,4-cyclodiphosphate synthase